MSFSTILRLAALSARRLSPSLVGPYNPAAASLILGAVSSPLRFHNQVRVAR